jgi:hypothetical protein
VPSRLISPAIRLSQNAVAIKMCHAAPRRSAFTQQRTMAKLIVTLVASLLLFAPGFPLVMAQAQPSPAPVTQTGIEGLIMMSPSHGGPIRQGEDDSRPVTSTAFVVSAEDKIVGGFSTDDHGRFQILLPPGRYSVSAKGAKRGVGMYGPFQVEVVAGKMQKVRWECDSGMR